MLFFHKCWKSDLKTQNSSLKNRVVSEEFKRGIFGALDFFFFFPTTYILKQQGHEKKLSPGFILGLIMPENHYFLKKKVYFKTMKYLGQYHIFTSAIMYNPENKQEEQISWIWQSFLSAKIQTVVIC